MNLLLLSYLGLFVNPLLGVIFFILDKTKKNKVLFLSVLMGIISASMIPARSYDVVRYYLYYDKTTQQVSFLNSFISSIDSFKVILIYFYRFLGIKKELIPFTFTFITYFTHLKSLESVIRDKTSQTKLFWVYFFLIDFFSAMFGLRNMAAVGTVIFSLIYTSDKKKTLLFSNSIHLMTVVYTMIFLLLKKLNNYFSIRKLRFCFILTLITRYLCSGNFIIKLINNLLPNFLSSYLKAYTEGIFAGEHLNYLSFKGIIFREISFFMNYWTIVFMIFFSLEKLTKKESFLVKFNYLSLIWVNIIYMFKNMSGRYSSLPNYLTVLIFFSIFQKNNLKKRKEKIFLNTLIGIVVIILLSRIYTMRETLNLSFINLFKPTLWLLFGNEIHYKSQL